MRTASSLRLAQLPLLTTVLILLAATLSWNPLACAQDSLGSDPPPVVDGPIRYVGPDTYILMDAEGNPQPVLGLKYEEFIAAWKELRELESREKKPRFTIEEMRINGRARDGHVEASAGITIRLASDAPLRIPLGMSQAILQDIPQWKRLDIDDEGEGELDSPLVEYDRKLGGFVVRLEGKPGERYKATLSMLVPLVRDGSETTLRLNCPRALIGKLAVDVPTLITEAVASEGSLLSQESTSDGGTRLDVDGLSGDFRLSWSSATTPRAELATVLSAVGAIAVAIDGHSIRTDATLTVASYGGGFDRFRVRLPPGAQLIQDRSGEATSAPPAYRVTLEAADDKDLNNDQIALVELPEKQRGPVEISLSTEQPLGLSDDELATELAGFAVLGAVRQFGDVAIRVADDWQLRWKSGPHVRQVDITDLPPELEMAQPDVAFQYDRQPWSLRTLVTARPLRVHVTPNYLLDVEPDEAQLRVQLVYQVPGARAFEFRVALNGWEMTADPIESNGLVDRDNVVVTREGVLVLPLAQATSRRGEISFRVRRDLAPAAARIVLPLPVPEADSVAAAELGISASPGLELTPDLQQSRGLSPVPISAETSRSNVGTDVPKFRFRTYLPGAVFAAERTVRASEVAAEVATELKFAGREVEATQTIDLSVRYRPIDHLVLDVPTGWSIVDGEVEILLSNTGGNAGGSESSIEHLAVPIESELGMDGLETRHIEVALPQPRMGANRFRLRFHRSMASEAPVTGNVNLTLPLPGNATIGKHRVRIVGPPEYSLLLDPAMEQPMWHPIVENASAGSIGSSTGFEANGPVAELALLMQPISRELPPATVVERVWLQTWRVGNTIQDRAAFRIRTAGRTATVELPPLVSVDSVEVRVDGKLGDVEARERGRIVVGLPVREDAAQQPHTLELRYRRSAPTGMLNREIFTPPQLVASSALNEVYWHVVLPGDLHVVRSPRQLAPASRWQWLNAFWGRRPIKSQNELEDWVHATNQLAPAGGQSEYLYNGLAPVASIEIITAPRWLIVLAASGVVFAAALLWINVPAVRRPWIALLVAGLIAALAVAYPAPAFLFAQASVLGLLVAMVALALRRRTTDLTVRMPMTATHSTNLKFRPMSRPESVVTPVVPPASVTPSASVSAPETSK